MDRVWEVLAAFGAFGFCKAHVAAFAVPVYQSAWLKRHHPAAFYAGVLSHDPGMYPKRVIVQDARLSGVAVRPVDVNASGADWTVTEDPIPGLRVALREIKGISDAELAQITAAQPYASRRDFTERGRASRPVTERRDRLPRRPPHLPLPPPLPPQPRKPRAGPDGDWACDPQAPSIGARGSQAPTDDDGAATGAR